MTDAPSPRGRRAVRDDQQDDRVAVVRAVREATSLDVLSWRDLGGGLTTNLALRTPGGDVVARLHPATTTQARVAAEQAARAALAANGVPAVVATDLLRLPDGRVVEVEPLVRAPHRMRTAPRLVAGVQVLGRLHDVLRDADLPPEAATVRWSHHVPAEDAVGVAEAAAAVLRGRPDGLADQLLEHVHEVAALERRHRPHRVVQLTHGDFWDDNVLLDGEEVRAVLDFGFMASRARVDDLALPLWFWLLEPGHGPPGPSDDALLGRCVDAYDRRTRRPLDPHERAALPLAVARQPVWTAHLCVLDPARAVAHAARVAAELPLARAVLDRWGARR